MMQLDEASFDAQVLASEKPVLVDFTAAWCPPCRMQKPVLERFAADHPEITVVSVDVDRSPALAARHGITGMPTLILFRQGKPQASARGLQSAAAVAALVESALSGP